MSTPNTQTPPATVEVDVRLGVTIVVAKDLNGQVIAKRNIFHNDPGKATVGLQQQVLYKDADDAESPDQPWEDLQLIREGPLPETGPTAERNEEIWQNNLYTVIRSNFTYPGDPDGPDWIHLSIRRNDRRPITDWRHKQKIKNQLAGPEHEGVEIYPAESRLVDTSNQFHCWVLPEAGQRVPVGYEDGRIVGSTAIGKAKQRPLIDGEDETVTPDKIAEMMDLYKNANPGSIRSERDDVI